MRGLETLGGFGGVADRLNQYNHFLGNPDYLAQDIGRYRAATPATLRDVAARTLTTSARVVIEGVPGAKVLDDVPRKPVAAAKAAPSQASRPTEPDWRAAQPAPAPASSLALPVPQRFTLPNGLTVLLLEQHKLPVIAANLYVLRGSEANPAQLPGLAAFTADMLDEGTTTRSALKLADDVAQIGATLGAGSSSDTSLSEHRSAAPQRRRRLRSAGGCRAAARPSREPRSSACATSGMTDAAAAARRPARAGGARVQPRRVRRRPPLRLHRARHGRVRSRRSRAPTWSSSGRPATCRAMRRWSSAATSRRTTCGSWRSGISASGPAPRPACSCPRRRVAAGRTVIVVDKPGAPQTALRIGQVGVPRSNPDYVPLEVMNTDLGGLFSSRINMNLREQHGYTYGASSRFAYRRGPGPFYVGTSVRADATAPAVREIFNELERMRATTVTEDELRLARDSFARSLPGLFETTADSVGSVGQIYVYGLPLDYYGTLPASIDKVGAADVQRVAQQYLAPERMAVVAVGDRKLIAPGLVSLKLGPVELRDFDGNAITAPPAR